MGNFHNLDHALQTMAEAAEPGVPAVKALVLGEGLMSGLLRADKAPTAGLFVPRDTLHGTVTPLREPMNFLSIVAPRIDLVRDLIWEGEPPAFRML
jgi:hypothetical protein